MIAENMLPASRQPAEGPGALAAYDYSLPAERIAAHPAKRRVQARLLVLKGGQAPSHCKVAHLAKLLRPGDLLVMNDTKVVPARLMARKPTGGKVEVLLLSPAQPQARDDRGELHQALLKSHRPLAAGAELILDDAPGLPEVRLMVVSRGERGQALIWTQLSGLELARTRGQMPLPPYIKRPQGPLAEDARRYQTVYAAHEGAVAAPTAGLHLSPALLEALEKRGVETARLTLHVGYGTFAEPRPEDLAAGRLHAEWVEMPPETCQAVARTKARGGRVVAVGTTSARALEWRAGPGGVPRAGAGWCDLLIAEGHKFKAVDGLVTNFHLPRTTLLMLVSALAGRERILAAYAQAVEKGYRFYSYGDAMLIV
jgi:S-adenosylmethionine:tRNA ribosyltransferase-isomerase